MRDSENLDNEKRLAWRRAEKAYRETHSRDGYGLGSEAYPDNREGRRALKRSWKRTPLDRGHDGGA